MLVPKPLYLIRIIQNDQVDDFTILYVYACVCVCVRTLVWSPQGWGISIYKRQKLMYMQATHFKRPVLCCPIILLNV